MVSAQPRLRTADRDKFDDLLAEARLVRAHEAGPGHFQPELARVLATSGRPLRSVVQALVRRRAWHERGPVRRHHAAQQPADRAARCPGRLTVAEVGKAAAALALAAGDANAAVHHGGPGAGRHVPTTPASAPRSTTRATS